MATATTGPLLGTAYLSSQQSAPTSSTRLTPTLCHNTSAFRALLRQSRALDDALQVRLNREAALARSSDSNRRHNNNNNNNTAGDAACDMVWSQLTRAWSERLKAVEFCLGVVEGGADKDKEKEQTTTGSASVTTVDPNTLAMAIETGLDRDLRRGHRPGDSGGAQGSMGLNGRGESELEVKRRHLHLELSIEQILHQRAVDVLASKCPDLDVDQPSSSSSSTTTTSMPDVKSELERLTTLTAAKDDHRTGIARGRRMGIDVEDAWRGGAEGRRGGRDGRGGVRWNG